MTLRDTIIKTFIGCQCSVNGEHGIIVNLFSTQQERHDTLIKHYSALIRFDNGLEKWFQYENIEIIDNAPLPLPG